METTNRKHEEAVGVVYNAILNLFYGTMYYTKDDDANPGTPEGDKPRDLAAYLAVKVFDDFVAGTYGKFDEEIAAMKKSSAKEQ